MVGRSYTPGLNGWSLETSFIHVTVQSGSQCTQLLGDFLIVIHFMSQSSSQTNILWIKFHAKLSPRSITSIQFSCSVIPDSVQACGLQHARLPCNAPSSRSALRRPLLLPPSVSPSIKVFSSEPVLHIRWPKYWSFSFSINPSSEYSRLMPFRIYWLDLLEVQRTLKGLLQDHNSKASVLLCSVFIMVQLSHPYTTSGNTITLTRRTFVGTPVSIYIIKKERDNKC